MAEHHAVSTSTVPPSTQQHRGSSHTITRPKIKIIHIIAPEIIKTDVANFRDLVQRLTGKQPTAGAAAISSVNTSPLVEKDKEEMVKKRPPQPPAAAPVTAAGERSGFLARHERPSSKKRKIRCEVKVEEGGFGDCGLEWNDSWMDLNPGGSFFSFLEQEEEDIFQGLVADQDFLQLPLGPARMDLVGEMYAS